jgi:hypothetical protein
MTPPSPMKQPKYCDALAILYPLNPHLQFGRASWRQAAKQLQKQLLS